MPGDLVALRSEAQAAVLSDKVNGKAYAHASSEGLSGMICKLAAKESAAGVWRDHMREVARSRSLSDPLQGQTSMAQAQKFLRQYQK